MFKDIGFRAAMLKKGGQHVAPEVLRRLQEDERLMRELLAKEEKEAELIAAGMRMASADADDAHDKVDALETFIAYSAADYKMWHDRKADWDKAMTKFAEFAFGLVKTKPPTPLLMTQACIDDMTEGEPAYKGGLALLLWHPFERGVLKVFAATEGSEYETGMNVKAKSGVPASIDAWAAIHVSRKRRRARPVHPGWVEGAHRSGGPHRERPTPSRVTLRARWLPELLGFPCFQKRCRGGAEGRFTHHASTCPPLGVSPASPRPGGRERAAQPAQPA